MQARTAVALVFLALIAWFSACSSGLGNDPRRRPQASTGSNSNRAVGIDLGVTPTSPAAEPAVAGFSIPAYGDEPARDVVLLAFTTAAAANDGDSAGNPIARDTVSDGNGASDVFVAAVCAQDIETRAFSQSLAGKFRHPRCTTCHSMQAATTQAFASSALPHAGPPPGPTFPNLDPATCQPCHVNSTAFPVVGWQAPAASFDMRTETVAQIADRATRIPTGDLEHFVTDARVLWALDSGILPTVGGRNGIADDDHDGVAEPEDEDGVPRTVPGGSVNFIAEIEAWNASGRVVTAASAVKDVTLVSRANGTSNAGNGASRTPKLKWVANPSFDPTSAASAALTNPVGTLYVVFESDASDLVAAGDGNGTTDVYRALVTVRVEENATGAAEAGGINLVYQDGSTVLVSARDGTTTAGNGASTNPMIGGSAAQFVAFQSAATDLVAGFTDANGTGTDVFVRRVLPNTTQLISHTIGNTATGGNGTSVAPAIDGTGVAVAFASDASDLIASDLNGVRDVFAARVDGGAPFTKTRASVSDTGAEATGGDSSAASIHVDGTRVLVAYQSDATNLAPTLAATTNVYLFDGDTGFSTLLNQKVSTTGTAAGNGAATAPVLADDGARVAFLSAANNLDVVRTSDANRSTDVFLVEVAQVAQGNVLPFRVSMTTNEGADANGSSSAPALGASSATESFGSGFIAYPTAATNLGTADSTNLMVSFLNETSGVFASFTAFPTRGAVPLTVLFTDTSTGDPTSWQWDFDNDGDVDATGQNPSYTFTTAGSYTVKLVAANANASGEKTEAAFVLAIGTPTASFTSSASTGIAPATLTFTDTSTQSPTSWAWDFEDDGTVDSTAQNPTHAFTTAGSYTVRLTVTNEAGSATTTSPITIFTRVAADFSGTPLAGIAPVTVTFTDLTTGDVSAWAWDFDNDGNVDSTDQNPTHTYTSPGNYTVKLTATGNGGTDTETKSNYAAIAGAVVADFVADATSQYDNVAVNFTDLSTGTVSTWAWDFENDGTVDSTAQNPSHTFSTPGTYTVKLVASGPGGTDTEIKTNYITSVASSITVNITAAKDTSIYSSTTTNSNGANEQMVCGRAYNGVTDFGIRRALVEFDVSSIPSTATVLSASLQLTCTYNPATPTGAQTVSLYRVTREWTEGTTNSGIGGGGAAAGGDATWSNATSGGTAWTTAGGDFNGTATRSTSVNTAGTYTWTTNSSMVSDVQTWVGNATNNHGWVLRANETANQRSAKVFGSRDNATAGNRPILTVTYRPAL